VRETSVRDAVNIFIISANEIGIGRATDDGLKLFGITKAGLLAMTISVLALWSCLALQTTTLRRAARDARAAVRIMERLREESVPASEPTPPFRSPSVKSS
jgi:hypothetical protein